jgi:hypothetical protein
MEVMTDPQQMEAMLTYSGGTRRVPVIVENEKIIIGFEGKT